MNFNNERPIYLQIVELIEQDIVAGKYQPKEKLPSVREMAVQYKVNPNTMQRAFSELESRKLVYTERTNGRFVCDDGELIQTKKDQLIRNRVQTFLQSMDDLGVDEETLLIYMKEERKGE